MNLTPDEREEILTDYSKSCIARSEEPMTFLDLLKQIQKDGPINILGEKTMAIAPHVFDEIVKEFEDLLCFRDALVQEKKVGDKLYDTIRLIAETLKTRKLDN